MKLKFPKTLLSGPIGTLMVPTIFGLSLGAGCAHQQTVKPQVMAQQKKISQLTARLQEVERTNGRLNVRVENLEDQLFLLQDMAESNRIALRRRGKISRGTELADKGTRAKAPGPTPESYYGSDSPYGKDDDYPSRAERKHRVTRIQLSHEQAGGYGDADPAPSSGDMAAPSSSPSTSTKGKGGKDDEIVITQDEYKNFVGDSPASHGSHAHSNGSAAHKAQPPVTDEKLATSDHDTPPKKDDKPAPAVATSKRPLQIYKGALADYRAGNYSQALAGFQAFMNAGPNPNYLDNALYWIGECHYGLGEYDTATKFFQRVLREHPDGNKVPDSMLKMSLAYERLGKPAKTRALLEKLTTRYPTTNAGRLGAQKLKELAN